MTKAKLSDEEIYSRLTEFRHICLELAVLNGLFYKKINESTDYKISDMKVPTEFDFVITFLIDAAVIRLVRLFKVQPTLGRVLKEKTDDGTNLLLILSDLWNQIKSNKEKIEDIWRNKIIAHSEDQIKNYHPYHALDPDYNKTFESILTAVRLAPLYYMAILNYAKHLFDEAQIHVNFKFGESDEFLIKNFLNELNTFEKKVLSDINSKLQKNGFESIPIPKYEGIF